VRRSQARARGDQHRLASPPTVEQLGTEASKPTVKQHLAAIRQLFDYLTTGGILEVNPAASVRGPKYVVKRGKIPRALGRGGARSCST
jgi:site-specific recombinase XerC